MMQFVYPAERDEERSEKHKVFLCHENEPTKPSPLHCIKGPAETNEHQAGDPYVVLTELE